MRDQLAPQDDAATPLDVEERRGLIPSYITLRRELNEAEQANILEAETWAFARKRDVLSESALNNLHRRMFGHVWKWAGQFRTTERNVGVHPARIATDLRQLVGDCHYQIENNSYPPDELAARFHHRLVFIHPYPNGNGRHSRLAADILVVALGRPRFTWGSANLVDVGQTRQHYVEALRAADTHDMRQLLEFVRS
jgi:Fic-DOC domain mobile mystery protein B